jgi:DNA-binding IclR family transcriptional regulator
MIQKSRKEKLNAIEKALEILTAFTNANKGLCNGEVSRITGFHKATTSRILLTMVEYGLIVRSDETKRYNLGPLAYRIGVSRMSQSIQGFIDTSGPHVDRLRDNINESISLEVWSGSNTVACYFAESRNALRATMDPADILPLHAPAGAKAILSFMHSDLVEKLLDYEFELLTENTISSKPELLKRLQQFKNQGYAVDNQELHAGIYAIGVPIFDHLSKPVAAICTVMPATRISAERESVIVQHLKKTASAISHQLKVLPSSSFRP